MMKNMSAHLAQYGITVNDVCLSISVQLKLMARYLQL